MTFELRLILAIFTCYRLARMIALDDGPGYIFEEVRAWTQDKADKEPSPFGKWHNLSEGLTCPFCAGVWVSLPLFVLVMRPKKIGDAFLILMTISGVQAFLQSQDRR